MFKSVEGKARIRTDHTDKFMDRVPIRKARSMAHCQPKAKIVPQNS